MHYFIWQRHYGSNFPYHGRLALFNYEFGNDIKGLASNIVNASLHVYLESSKNLLPTPTKSHYTFNLRDLARIIQGVLLVKPYDGFDGDALKRLWVHESSRVIIDRLVEQKDQEWFLSLLDNTLKLDLSSDLDSLIGHLDPSVIKDEGTDENAEEGDGGKGNLDALRRLFFGNYSEPNGKPRYVEIQDVPSLVPLFNDYLENYNSESKTPMNLVMFIFAIEHISRISRVLAMPRGNLLSCGCWWQW